MNLFVRILRMFLHCRHDSMYRERRQLHGADVVHLVCENCGYAVPALQRAAEDVEHRRPAEVVAIGLRGLPKKLYRRQRGGRSRLRPSA